MPLPILGIFAGINNAVSIALTAYHIVKSYIDKEIQKTAKAKIRLAQKEIKELLDGFLLEYIRYIIVNVLLLCTIAFLTNVVAQEENLMLLATGYVLILCRMTMSASNLLRTCWTQCRFGRITLSIDGTLCSLLDAEIEERAAKELEQVSPKLRWIYNRLGLVDSAKEIIAEGLKPVLKKNIFRFCVLFSLAWSIYLTLTHFFVTPLMTGTEGMNPLLACIYPFYASVGIFVSGLFANHPLVVLYAILFCFLFAKTVQQLNRHMGVLLSFMAWIIFLTVTAALLERADFSCIGIVLFLQTFLTFEKCTTDKFIYPGFLN